MTFSSVDDDLPPGTIPPLRQMFDRLRERLADREAQVAKLFADLRDEIAQLSRQVDDVPRAVPARPAAAKTAEVGGRDDSAEFEFEITPPKPQPLRPARDVVPAAASSVGADVDIEQMVFGPELSASASHCDEREELLGDLTAGNAAAMTLAGAILLFRGASAERLPLLLKDIGEAWYGWRLHTADGPDPLRDELTGWLERKCDEAGVPNTIELVRPGDRYDSKRHFARQPGVEVVDVGGWVVLRDNGKVYTKATVTVK